MEQKIFMDCCMCDEYNTIEPYDPKHSLHGNCTGLRDEHEPCVIEWILTGRIGAYRSIPAIPVDNPPSHVWNIKKAPAHSRPYRAYSSVTNEPIKYDSNLVRLIDWCNRQGAMHRLLFKPTKEERTNTLNHICI